MEVHLPPTGGYRVVSAGDRAVIFTPPLFVQVGDLWVRPEHVMGVWAAGEDCELVLATGPARILATGCAAADAVKAITEALSPPR